MVGAGQCGQLLDKLAAFLTRYQLRGLDGVDKQLQFRQFKITGSDKVAAVLAVPEFNIKPILPERLYILIDNLSCGWDIIGRKGVDNALRCDFVDIMEMEFDSLEELENDG